VHTCLIIELETLLLFQCDNRYYFVFQMLKKEKHSFCSIFSLKEKGNVFCNMQIT